MGAYVGLFVGSGVGLPFANVGVAEGLVVGIALGAVLG